MSLKYLNYLLSNKNPKLNALTLPNFITQHTHTHTKQKHKTHTNKTEFKHILTIRFHHKKKNKKNWGFALTKVCFVRLWYFSYNALFYGIFVFFVFYFVVCLFVCVFVCVFEFVKKPHTHKIFHKTLVQCHTKWHNTPL